MKKIFFLTLLLSLLLSSHSQVDPIFESEQGIFHLGAGVNKNCYSFDLTYTRMLYDDLFGIDNFNFGLGQVYGFFIVKPKILLGLNLDSYCCIHYTIFNNFALMLYGGLTVNTYLSKLISLVYFVGAEYLITDQFGIYLKTNCIDFVTLNGGLFFSF